MYLLLTEFDCPEVTLVARQIPPASTEQPQRSQSQRSQLQRQGREAMKEQKDKARKLLSSHCSDDVDPAVRLVIDNVKVRTAGGSDW